MWQTRVHVSGPVLDAEFSLPMTQESALDVRRRFRAEKGLSVGTAPAWSAYRWLRKNQYFHARMTASDRVRLAVWVTRSWVV